MRMSYLKKHQLTHKAKKYKCNECWRSYSSNSGYLRHIKSHQSENYVQCGDCGKILNDEADRESHRRLHSGKKHKCDHCNWSFDSKRDLESHAVRHTDKWPFCCEGCGKVFKRKYSLERHQKKFKSVQCSECDKEFICLSSLSLHMNEHHKMKNQFSCPKCEMSTDSRFLLYEHFEKDHFPGDKSARIACDDCDSTFTRPGNLSVHRKMVHHKFMWTCKICEKSFKKRYQMNNHVNRLHNKVKAFECHVCGMKYRYQTSLQIHKLSKHGIGTMKFKCTHCGQTFIERKLFTKHVRKHTGEKPFLCSYCGQTFAMDDELKRHLIKVHQTGSGFTCDSCGKLFFKRYLLKAHLGKCANNNTDQRRLRLYYNCRHCGLKFKGRQTLSDHLNEHTMEERKPFACSECGKAYGSKYYLSYHMKIHTGQTPFKCHFCSKGFALRADLRRHLCTHTGEGEHPCEECGRKFSSKWSLSKHVKIVHKKERPFPCQRCGRCFGSKSVLGVHMQTHTGVKPYPCDLCDMTFSEKRSMLKHRQKHTDDTKLGMEKGIGQGVRQGIRQGIELEVRQDIQEEVGQEEVRQGVGEEVRQGVEQEITKGFEFEQEVAQGIEFEVRQGIEQEITQGIQLEVVDGIEQEVSVHEIHFIIV